MAAESGAGYVLMHIQGTPETMQQEPHYTDVVAEVRSDETVAQRGRLATRPSPSCHAHLKAAVQAQLERDLPHAAALDAAKTAKRLHIVELHEVRSINNQLAALRNMGFEIDSLIPQERTGEEEPRYRLRRGELTTGLSRAFSGSRRRGSQRMA